MAFRYTPTPTASITPTISLSPSITPTNTPTGTVCPGLTPTATPSPSLTQTITPTNTATQTTTPTITPTSQTPTPTTTNTPTPSTTPPFCESTSYLLLNNTGSPLTWEGYDCNDNFVSGTIQPDNNGGTGCIKNGTLVYVPLTIIFQADC